MKIEFFYSTKLSAGLNAREHWAVKAKRNKTHRMAACVQVIGATNNKHRSDATRQDFAAGKLFSVTLTAHTSRQPDDDNLRSKLKSIRDGVADGIQSVIQGHMVRETDDSKPMYRWSYGWQKCKRGETGCAVAIEVE
jgi:hypothetical protein